MTTAPNLLNLISSYNIVVFMLVMTRISGLFLSAPFFSTITMPQISKVWFSALISFILFPLIVASNHYVIPHKVPEFLILLICEYFIGYLIGFIADIILQAVRIAGNILSIQTSLSISEALDPATGTNVTELTRIYLYLALLIFLATGAYQALFTALYASFTSIPMGTFPYFDSNIIMGVLTLFGQLFKIAFGLALPIFGVLLICDTLLGLMSKMMPQMNIYMVAIPVKIYLGLILIFIFLSPTTTYLQTVMANYFHAITALVK